MIKSFQLEFEELNITPNDLSGLLGFDPGQIPEPFPGLIENTLSAASDLCNIKGGYKIYSPVKFSTNDRIIETAGVIFNPAKVVTTQLRNSSEIAVFVCTAGVLISGHSKKLMDEGDLMAGYVFDVLGSVIVEKAMDKIQEFLKIEMNSRGLGVTDRFSPGYCDWDVAEQQKLFSLLPEKFCGIILSESSLMSPIKSVSGIIGIGPELRQKGYQCDWCNDKTCIYGNIKRRASKKQ